MAESVQAGSLVGERLGKYEMLALLAIGGTAEIYLARIGGEAGFEKYVVVKCLLDHLADDAEFVRMFLDEARLGAQLDHSNIVQTLELGEHKNRYYMVMEYLAGMSLAQLARKTQERVVGGLMPIDLVLGLTAQACAGLHYAHERSASDGKQLNIVHRDVSPQNLVVSFDGVLKIVDFGIAKADLRQTNTRSGTIKGKFAYMSPEQCLAKPIDRRTDIFALGVIVHELLTARRLFKRSTTYETYQAIVTGGVPKPSQVNHQLDPALDEVVMRALCYEREERYPSAEAFGEALLGVLHRRGRSVSANDIAQYYEQHFAAELDEHGQRMRELISGRARSVEDLTWDGLDEREEPLIAMLPASEPDEELASLLETNVRNVGSEQLLALAEARRDPEELEGDATRIELNPLRHIEGGGQDSELRGSDDDTRDDASGGNAQGMHSIEVTLDSAVVDPPDLSMTVGEVTGPTKQVDTRGAQEDEIDGRETVALPPSAPAERGKDRPTVTLSPRRDTLARIPQIVPVKQAQQAPVDAGWDGAPIAAELPAPAGKAGARRRTESNLPVPGPSAPDTGPPANADIRPDDVDTLFDRPAGQGNPSSPTEASPPASTVFGAVPAPVPHAARTTLFAPGGAPMFKMPAPGSDRAAAGQEANAGEAQPSQPQPHDASAPGQTPFGAPPSLTTDPGGAEAAPPALRPMSVPPDTLPAERVGEDTKETVTTLQDAGEYPPPHYPEKFPPTVTPTPLRGLVGGNIVTSTGIPPAHSDVGRLRAEKLRPWLIVLAFIAAVGLGMGATVLIANLIA